MCSAIGWNLKLDGDPENAQHDYKGIDIERGHLTTYEIADAGLRHTGEDDIGATLAARYPSNPGGPRCVRLLNLWTQEVPG